MGVFNMWTLFFLHFIPWIKILPVLYFQILHFTILKPIIKQNQLQFISIYISKQKHETQEQDVL